MTKATGLSWRSWGRCTSNRRGFISTDFVESTAGLWPCTQELLWSPNLSKIRCLTRRLWFYVFFPSRPCRKWSCVESTAKRSWGWLCATEPTKRRMWPSMSVRWVENRHPIDHFQVSNLVFILQLFNWSLNTELHLFDLFPPCTCKLFFCPKPVSSTVFEQWKYQYPRAEVTCISCKFLLFQFFEAFIYISHTCRKLSWLE